MGIIFFIESCSIWVLFSILQKDKHFSISSLDLNKFFKLFETVFLLAINKDEETSIIQAKIPLESDLNNFNKSINDAKKSLESLKEFKVNFEDNKNNLELQVSQLSQELEDFKLIQQNTLYELDKLKNTLNDKSYNIQIAYKKIANLEGQKAAFEEVGLGKAVETVMAANIDGVHAPLLQLGTVEKEYSTALEVAMGGRMKNIVVEDDEVAVEA